MFSFLSFGTFSEEALLAVSATGDVHPPARAASFPAPPQVAYAFLDARGRITYTNNPQSYRHRPDYCEVPLERVLNEQAAIARAAQPDTALWLLQLVRRSAAKYGVDTDLVLAVIEAESHFKPRARSRQGAKGLMQLMPATAAAMGMKNPYDEAENVAAGTRYLASLLKQFDQDPQLALAAYNAGPTAVRRHGAVPPFKETRAFVKRVLRYVREYKRPGERLRRIRKSKTYGGASPHEGRYYTVYFTDGASQSADLVVEGATHYYIVADGATALQAKDKVARVINPL